MKAQKRIQSLFARCRVGVPPDLDERVIGKALSAFDDAVPRPAGESGRPARTKSVHGRLAKIAAAILVLATVAAIVVQIGLPLDGSHAAFAQVRQALQQKPWMHVVMTARTTGDEPDHTHELWFAPQRQIRIIKSDDLTAPVLWSDYLTRERQCYEPKSNRLTLSYEYEQVPESRDPPWNYLGYILGPDALPNSHVVERTETFEQKQARVYDVTMEEEEGVVNLRLVTNMVDRLPIAMTIEAIDTQGRQRASLEAHFDYPPVGPENIYAVGAPRNAEVIDERPTPQAQDLARICHEYRTLLQRYIFIVIGVDRRGTVGQVEVYYVSGDTSQAGRQWKTICHSFVPWPPSGEPQQLHVDGLQSAGDVLRWIENDDGMKLMRVALWDGRYLHSIEAHEEVVYRKGRTPGGRRDLHGYAWPCYVPSGRIAEDEFSRRNGLVCWQTQGRTFHFDPGHDYVCVRLEQSDGTWIRETVDFARTEAGLWYPRTVQLTIVTKDAAGQEVSHEVTHVDKLFFKPVPEFPRGTFDPDRFPKTAEALRAHPKLLRIDPA